MKILVVFPEEGVRESFRMILKIKDYEVITAIDGQSGLSLINPSFDMVFTDYRMPGIDGLEVLKRIKDIYPFIPIVIVTSYASKATHAEALRLGALEYLRMPFLMEEIYELIERGINARYKFMKDRSLFDIQIDQLTILLTQCEMKEREGAIESAIVKCLDAIKIIPHPKIFLKLSRLYKKTNFSLAIEKVNQGLYFQNTQGLGAEEVAELLKAELSPSQEIYCSDCWEPLLIPVGRINLEFHCPKCNNLIRYKLQNKTILDAFTKFIGVYDYGYKTSRPYIEPPKKIEILTPEIVYPEIKVPEAKPYTPFLKKKRKKEIDFDELDLEWIETSSNVKQRDRYRCKLCKTCENLHVHHVIPRSEGGDNSLDNLETLCDKCHRIQIGAGHKLIGKKVKFISPFQIKVRPIIKQARKLRKKIDELLIRGIEDHEILKMYYKKPLEDGGVEISRREIDVYGIKGDYIGCYCHLRKALRTFKISRIQGLFPTESHFEVVPKMKEELENKEFWRKLSF